MKRFLLLTMLIFTASGLVQAKQKLTLLSPNGGGTLVSGTPQMITWSHADMTGSETVLIFLEGATDSGPINYCDVLQGSYEWLVGKKMDGTFAKPASNYMIIIELVENDGISDMSDASFTIAGTVPNISLMTPNGGESLKKETGYDINWAFAGKTGFVSLTLVKDEQPLGLIAENIPAMNFRHHWHVGDPLLNGSPYGAGGNYRIQIQWRLRPGMAKDDLGETKAPGGILSDKQKNIDRSDGTFSIQETETPSQQNVKAKKE